MKRTLFFTALVAISISLSACSKGGEEDTGSGVEPIPPKVKVLSVATRVGVQNKIKVSGYIEPNG